MWSDHQAATWLLTLYVWNKQSGTVWLFQKKKHAFFPGETHCFSKKNVKQQQQKHKQTEELAYMGRPGGLEDLGNMVYHFTSRTGGK